jgi:hypothetical protein
MRFFFQRKKRGVCFGVCSLIGASESAAAVWGAIKQRVAFMKSFVVSSGVRFLLSSLSLRH